MMAKRKQGAWLVVGIVVHATYAFGQWTGGPVIIGGDDADNHFVDPDSGIPTGRPYMREAFNYLGAHTLKCENKRVVCIGCNALLSPEATDAFELAFDDSALSTLQGGEWETAILTDLIEIQAFYDNTGAINIEDTGIIYLPSSHKQHGGLVNGGITELQLDLFNDNVAILRNFVLEEGGGLFVHALGFNGPRDPGAPSPLAFDPYLWLESSTVGLIPEIFAITPTSGSGLSELELTCAARAKFLPGLTAAEVDQINSPGPPPSGQPANGMVAWHRYFRPKSAGATGDFTEDDLPGLFIIANGPGGVFGEGVSGTTFSAVILAAPEPFFFPQTDCNLNGILDACEILDVGGCCLPGGECSVLDECACVDQGGHVAGMSQCPAFTCSNDIFQNCTNANDCPPFACVGGANDGGNCTENGDADCLDGGCVGGPTPTAFCTDDANCAPDGTCEAGVCSGTPSCLPPVDPCATGACCESVDGSCTEDMTPIDCSNIGGMFQGGNTDCEQHCCPRPIDATSGSDSCESAIQNALQIEVPEPGACPVLVTLTGDNSGAISVDSCFTDASPEADPGWFVSFTITECAMVRFDFCCSDPIKTPIYDVLYDQCPCGTPIPSRADAFAPMEAQGAASGFGAPFCDDLNGWAQFGPLPAGTYTYPIYSKPGSMRGRYQLHLTVSRCRLAACCLPTGGSLCTSNFIVNIDDNGESTDCQTDSDCTGGPPDSTCDACVGAIEAECVNRGGFWLAGDNIAGIKTCDGGVDAGEFCETDFDCTLPGICTQKLPVVACVTAQPDGSTVPLCEFGSCCLGPNDCIDDLDTTSEEIFIPVDEAQCLLNPGATFVGGTRCDFPVNPCPLCDPDELGFCQDQTRGRTRESSTRSGASVADDFVALGTSLGQICLSGSYFDTVPTLSPCGSTIDLDRFEVRIYDDANGLPGAVIGERSGSEITMTKVFVDGTDSFAEYQLIFSTPVSLVPGKKYWLEVVNDATATTSTCKWYWDSAAGAGNDYGVAKSTATYGIGDVVFDDRAFCLDLIANTGLETSLLEDVRTILLVDVAALPGGDGRNWETAFDSLQDAMLTASVRRNGVKEIWVAQGIYRADQGIAVVPGDRSASFLLVDGVQVYGGFVGNERTTCDRNPETNVTILSGDLLGDDGMAAAGNDCCGPNPSPGCNVTVCNDAICNGILQQCCGTRSWDPMCAVAAVENCCDTCKRCDNSMHVVSASNVGPGTVLDGFTITGGVASGTGADSKGGGVFLGGSASPAIRNCVIADNVSTTGAGLHIETGNPVISNTDFSENVARQAGGAIRSFMSSPIVSGCTFGGNEAVIDGGAVLIEGGSPYFANCVFYDNRSSAGGAMCLAEGGTPVIVNSVFSGNIATDWSLVPTGPGGAEGGAVFSFPDSGDATYTNCTFFGNHAEKEGGGINAGTTSPTVTNSILWGNSDNSGTSSAPAQIFGGTPTVTNSCIQDEDPDDGTVFSGTGNIDDDPMFAARDASPSNLRLLPGSPSVDTGDNTLIGPDLADLDDDGVTSEDVPFDLDGGPRIRNLTVDMGAYEADGTVLYVDANISGGDGLAWGTAYSDIQAALASVNPGGQIWVAEGTYTPHEACSPSCDRTKSFQLVDGVQVFGGFAPNGSFGTRDPVLHPTVLSGDLLGDDATIGITDNSYHVVVANAVGASTLLDGFTIKGGNANDAASGNDDGGGIRALNSSQLVVQDCVIEDNNADASGGGMHDDSGAPSIIRSTFRNNVSSATGGGLSTGGSSTVVGTTFDGNQSPSGGGVAVSSGSQDFVGNYFVGNLAFTGGGILGTNADALLANNVFSGNAATTGDGGALSISGGNLYISNCTFAGNAALNGEGGGVEAVTVGGSLTVSNCIFWGNVANAFAQLHDASGIGGVSVSHSDVQDGWIGTGNIDVNPNFVDSVGSDGIVGTVDDDLALYADSSCIDVGFNDTVPVAITTDFDGGTRFFDADGSGTADVDLGAYESPCMVVQRPTAGPELPELGDPGNGGAVRYLAIQQTNALDGSTVAVRVTVVTSNTIPGSEGLSWWVGTPQDVCEIAGKTDPADCIGGPTFKAARLSCTPVFTDWTALGTVFLYGEAIAPDSTYSVQAIATPCDTASAAPNNFSAPLALRTSIWGDIVVIGGTGEHLPPDSTVDVGDMTAIIDAFANRANSVSKARADLQPAVPDRIISILDVSFVLDGFKGVDYPFSEPASCP